MRLTKTLRILLTTTPQAIYIVQQLRGVLLNVQTVESALAVAAKQEEEEEEEAPKRQSRRQSCRTAGIGLMTRTACRPTHWLQTRLHLSYSRLRALRPYVLHPELLKSESSNLSHVADDKQTQRKSTMVFRKINTASTQSQWHARAPKLTQIHLPYSNACTYHDRW